MNLCIYQPRVSYFVGGGEVVPLEHARLLSGLGHKVTILTTRAEFIEPSSYFLKFTKENPRVKISYIDLPSSLGLIYQEKPGSRWIRWDNESLHVGRLAFGYLQRQSFDLIVVHNYVDLLAVPDGRKSVLHLHGYPDQSNYLHELLAGIPDGVIAVSKVIKAKWSKLAPLKGILVAENGIDSDRFRPKPLPLIYDAVYVGRLIETKGLRFLIEAVSKLRDLPLKVAIAGTGPAEAALKRQVAAAKLNSKVEFLGYVADADLPDLYNSSLMGVFPSYDREGILTTMLENASCGRPTITTTACSMKEFLRNNSNGLLVRPKSSAALAQAIRRLYADRTLADRLGRQARKAVEHSWSWQNKINRVEKYYESIHHRAEIS